MKKVVKNYFPGIITAGVLALLSVFLAGFGSFLGAATIALLFGILLGNVKIKFPVVEKGFSFTEKTVLETAIVFIAFGMNARIFSQLGTGTWVFIGSTVLIVIALTILIGRWFGLSLKMGALLGAGSAICGSAAIGAVSPLLKSEKEETGLSIGVINLLSTIGLLLLPLLSEVLALNTESAGLIIGGVLQSMGHVAGAGFSMGSEIGAAATVVKMGRILLIIPLMIILYIMSDKRKAGKEKLRFPLFIPLFILALLIAQFSFFPQDWSSALAQLGDFLLIAAMVAIGYKIQIKPLLKIAGPALAVGFMVFAFQIGIYLLYLYI